MSGNSANSGCGMGILILGVICAAVVIAGAMVFYRAFFQCA